MTENTPNTTASGAADFPEFPGHPEPQIMRWSALEIVAIRKYGADMFRAGRLAASAPVAPAPQPGSVLVPAVPTEEMMRAGYDAYDVADCYGAMLDAAPKAAPAPVAEDADPLQGAANWLVTSHTITSATTLGGRLCIGYNRAERLFNAARAQAAQPEGGANANR